MGSLRDYAYFDALRYSNADTAQVVEALALVSAGDIATVLDADGATPLLACDLLDPNNAMLLMLANDAGDVPLARARDGSNIAAAAAFAELIAGAAQQD
jgi:hypothetical protein